MVCTGSNSRNSGWPVTVSMIYVVIVPPQWSLENFLFVAALSTEMAATMRSVLWSVAMTWCCFSAVSLSIIYMAIDHNVFILACQWPDLETQQSLSDVAISGQTLYLAKWHRYLIHNAHSSELLKSGRAQGKFFFVTLHWNFVPPPPLSNCFQCPCMLVTCLSESTSS